MRSTRTSHAVFRQRGPIGGKPRPIQHLRLASPMNLSLSSEGMRYSHHANVRLGKGCCGANISKLQLMPLKGKVLSTSVARRLVICSQHGYNKTKAFRVRKPHLSASTTENGKRYKLKSSNICGIPGNFEAVIGFANGDYR